MRTKRILCRVGVKTQHRMLRRKHVFLSLLCDSWHTDILTNVHATDAKKQLQEEKDSMLVFYYVDSELEATLQSLLNPRPRPTPAPSNRGNGPMSSKESAQVRKNKSLQKKALLQPATPRRASDVLEEIMAGLDVATAEAEEAEQVEAAKAKEKAKAQANRQGHSARQVEGDKVKKGGKAAAGGVGQGKAVAKEKGMGRAKAKKTMPKDSEVREEDSDDFVGYNHS